MSAYFFILRDQQGLKKKQKKKITGINNTCYIASLIDVCLFVCLTVCLSPFDCILCWLYDHIALMGFRVNSFVKTAHKKKIKY